MNGKLLSAIWLAIVIAVVGLAPIDAAKANSRVTNHRTKAHAPNHDHVRLTHAAPSHSQPQHHNTNSHSYPRQQQQHVHQSHAPNAPALPPQTHASAPALPAPQAPTLPNTNVHQANQNNQIGWKVPNSDAAPKQTITNTNAGFQQPHAAAAPPPPYTPYTSNAGVPPPPYQSNPNVNHQSAGFQSSYPGQNVGGQQNAPSYPGLYPQQQHPQVPYNPSIPAQGSYPMQQQPSYVPGGQQPVINNFYQEQPKSGGGIGSGLQTAAIAGIGGLALYGALKPSEEKTIIIHDGGQTAAPAAVPAAPPNAAPLPAAPAVQTAAPAPIAPAVQPAIPAEQPAPAPAQPNPPAVFVTPVPSTDVVSSSSVPLAPLPQQTPVPLAPLPQDVSTSVPLAPMPQDNQQSVPLAPLPDQSTVVPLAPLNVTGVAEITTISTRLSSPEMATGLQSAAVPFSPNNTHTNGEAAHSPLKGSASNVIVFNMSFYACIAIALAKLF